jgi:hypothetical protein
LQPNVHATSAKRGDFSDLERAGEKAKAKGEALTADDFSPQAAALAAHAAAAAAAAAPSVTGAGGWSKPLKKAPGAATSTATSNNVVTNKKPRRSAPSSDDDGSDGGGVEGLLSPELMAELGGGSNASGELVLPSGRKSKDGQGKRQQVPELTPAETKVGGALVARFRRVSWFVEAEKNCFASLAPLINNAHSISLSHLPQRLFFSFSPQSNHGSWLR